MILNQLTKGSTMDLVLMIGEKPVIFSIDKDGHVWFEGRLVIMGHDWIQDGDGDDILRRDKLVRQEYLKWYERA